MAHRGQSIIPLIRLASVVIATCSICAGFSGRAYGQNPSDPTPAAPHTAAPGGTPATAGPTAAPTAVDLGAACKQAVASLGSGDLSGLESLPAETRAAIVRSQPAADLFTCLAVADGKPSYCDALPSTTKGACVEQSKFVRELGSLPKESVKAHIMHSLCVREASPADCDKVREATRTRNAAPCDQLSASEGAWGRDGMCKPLATGDTAKCAAAPEAAMRDVCVALATDDPARCPKGATDCVSMARNFAAIKQAGMESDKLDPTTAALRKGRKACAPLVAAVQPICSPADASGAGAKKP